METNYGNHEEIASLLYHFNNRDAKAFGSIYSLLYKELYFFCNKLYNSTTVDPKDTIQDIFMVVWQNAQLEFETIEKLKTYLFISIRNRFKTYYNHTKVVQTVNENIIKDPDLFTVYATEAEVFSLLPTVLNMLPEECAESFRLYIEGYSIKEIAEQLGKPLTTIYSQREKALSILRKRLPKDKVYLLLTALAKLMD